MQKNLAIVALLAIALSACGGSGGGSTVPSAPTGSKPAAHASATFAIKIPAPSSASGTMRPKFVSPSTQSVKVSSGGSVLGTFNTTPTSPGCSSANGVTACSFDISQLATGSQTLTVDAYDGTNGSGNHLSTGNVTQTIVAGQANTISVTMSGVVASLSLGVVGGAFKAGTAVTPALTVMAKDADGNVIVGPGNYSAPVTITDADTSGITQLQVDGGAASTSVQVNGPADRVAIVYNGKNITSFGLSAAATGATPATATIYPTPTQLAFYKLPTASSSTYYEPALIATGPDGNEWFSYYGRTPTASGYGIGASTTSGTLTLYAAGTAPATNLINSSVRGISPGTGTTALFFTQATSRTTAVVSTISTSGTVTNYTDTGSVLCSGFQGYSVVADGHGGAWVGGTCGGSANEIAYLSSSGQITLAGSSAALSTIEQLIVGKDGNLYGVGTLTTGNGAIVQATVTGTGTLGTISTIDTGSGSTSAGTGSLYFLAQVPNGDIYVSNESGCQNPQSQIGRLALSAGFSSTNFSLLSLQQGCLYPGAVLGLADGSVWIGVYDYEEILQYIPSTGAQNYLPYTNNSTVFGESYGVALGSDGNIWSTEYDDVGYNLYDSGGLIKFAY